MVAVTSLLLALGVGGFLAFELLASVSVVASWVSVALGVATGLAVAYNLVDKGFLMEIFDTEVVEVLSSSLIGVVTGFVVYRLAEALLASLGLLSVLVAGILVVLSIVFTPGYVLGGIATLVGFVADLLDMLGGDS